MFKKGRQKVRKPQRLFAVLFCPPLKSPTKKRHQIKSASKKRRQKSRRALQFGCQPKKDARKTPRPFWTAKGRLGNKVGKSRGTCVHLKYTLETESFKCEKLEKKAHNCYARSVCKLYARGLITDT